MKTHSVKFTSLEFVIRGFCHPPDFQSWDAVLQAGDLSANPDFRPQTNRPRFFAKSQIVKFTTWEFVEFRVSAAIGFSIQRCCDKRCLNAGHHHFQRNGEIAEAESTSNPEGPMKQPKCYLCTDNKRSCHIPVLPLPHFAISLGKGFGPSIARLGPRRLPGSVSIIRYAHIG